MSYTKTNWQDLPNTTTPITASNLNNMENGIKQNDTVLGGNAYDSTATYVIGDFCIYNNKLYRCTTAISTAEAFTPAHWEETSVENELDALRKSGGIPTNSVIGYDGSTIPSGFEEVDKPVDLQTFSITSVSGTTIGNNDFYICNGICHINAEVGFSSALSTNNWNNIGTLSEDYRPTKDIWFPISVYTRSFGSIGSGVLRITTGGLITAYTKLSSVVGVVINAEWRI